MSLNGAQGWPGGQRRPAAPSQRPHLLANPPDRPAGSVDGISEGTQGGTQWLTKQAPQGTADLPVMCQKA